MLLVWDFLRNIDLISFSVLGFQNTWGLVFYVEGSFFM